MDSNDVDMIEEHLIGLASSELYVKLLGKKNKYRIEDEMVKPCVLLEFTSGYDVRDFFSWAVELSDKVSGELFVGFDKKKVVKGDKKKDVELVILSVYNNVRDKS